eukprot:CAMPEP_0119571252 /NCGR_PEP_ID=MMETSP1352-20130426/44024_1 /TAXON_ID=265584 /ORGANISM="Stauroneis constricta, Strain CCMP1120" /LENGTH=455 /DNA_ID=CAMNT_0007620931 /DNA_START=1036 /DNA_END=2403 /DNA_ORIENTATION=-
MKPGRIHSIASKCLPSYAHPHHRHHQHQHHACKLQPFLARPTQVASTLEWKKHQSKILTLSIESHHLEVAVCHHPGTHRDHATAMTCKRTATHAMPVGASKRIPLHPASRSDDMIDSSSSSKTNRSEMMHASKPAISMSHDCTEYVNEIISKHDICGVIVSWPINPATRRAGKECGRVLYMLEQLVLSSSSLSIPSSSAAPLTAASAISEPSHQSKTSPACDMAPFNNKSLRRDGHNAASERHHSEPGNSNRTRSLVGISDSSTVLSSSVFPPICLVSGASHGGDGDGDDDDDQGKVACHTSLSSTTSPSMCHPDRWGRDPAYAYTGADIVQPPPAKPLSRTSNLSVERIWESFCRSHWPNLHSIVAQRRGHHVTDDRFTSSSWATSRRAPSTTRDDQATSALSPPPPPPPLAAVASEFDLELESVPRPVAPTAVTIRSLVGGHRGRDGRLHCDM